MNLRSFLRLLTDPNGSDNVDYDASITERIADVASTPGAFRGGATTGTPFADPSTTLRTGFDMSYDAVNGSSEAPVASYYTIQQGDASTGSAQAGSQGIAQTIWGDASLWYMLAEANGLTGREALVEVEERRTTMSINFALAK